MFVSWRQQSDFPDYGARARSQKSRPARESKKLSIHPHIESFILCILVSPATLMSIDRLLSLTLLL